MKKFKGKLVGDAQYFHKSAQKLLSTEIRDKIFNCIQVIGNEIEWNVIKINLKDGNKISLLNYEDFSQNAFPALLNSYQINLAEQTFAIRNHSHNNPPILHRKELLLPAGTKEMKQYTKLTSELEEIGAFSNITKLGTKVNWEAELTCLGIKITDHKIVDLEQFESTTECKLDVLRFRTAISRRFLSLPAKLLYQSTLANEDYSYLDSGCGRGDDVKFLKELNVPAKGWDPHYYDHKENLKESDIVNLGFVLNVIEDQDERSEVLLTAFALAKKCLCVAVMLHSQNSAALTIPFGDGQLSSIKTFQKYYSQTELEDLLTQNLQLKPIAAAPGVFFIFKDEVLEQDFLLKRQLGIIQDYEPQNLLSKVNEKKEKTERVLRLNQSLAKHILNFARKPELDELPRYFRKQLETTGISYRRIFSTASQVITKLELKVAVDLKKEQLSLFFAMYLFSKRPKYRNLSTGLQKDVKLHFGSMKDLEEKAKNLLYSLGNSDLLYSDCHQAEKDSLGFFDTDKFIFCAKNQNKIPLRLRGILAIAERLSGKIDDADLIKIHIESKKVSYLNVDGFNNSALPRILSRTIVDFRENKILTFDHTKDGKVKTVYLKSKLMNQEDQNYKIQKEFDDLIVNSLDFDFSGEGPRFDEFAKSLFKNKIVPPSYKK